MQGGEMEKDFLLQWGNRKRLRCFNKLKKQHHRHFVNSSNGVGGGSSSTTPPQSLLLPNNKKMGSSLVANRHKMNKPRSALASPEKEDRYYATRGSGSLMLDDNNNTTKGLMDQQVKEDKKIVWPRLFTTLSNKEKEQDFMAMKGCKLPQRPKKRAKLIQRSILLVSPGTWLSDLCQERYQVREKKTSKKKPRGLKAMGSMETDSERD
ncbi:uncharacterized protein LOC120167933 isoform X2 [Hibiscus syriacus]|uniref:uncharacterized protein LOC120167933 isoform X2 n=1 Tax=Hibiscus syriacus TaxID=106335 RepID=UPI001923934E|nr:uncharacterized protein LOC120167933 isoform X2 [Hibiscus syriacus]